VGTTRTSLRASPFPLARRPVKIVSRNAPASLSGARSVPFPPPFSATRIPCFCSNSSRTSSQNCARLMRRRLIWESRLPPRENPGDFPDPFCGMRPNCIPLIRLNQREKFLQDLTRKTSTSRRWHVVLRHLLGRGVNFPELTSPAFREPRRLGQDAIEGVMSGKCLYVVKEVHHPVVAAFGRANGSPRRCPMTGQSGTRLWKARCVLLHTDVLAHRNQTAKQETSAIPIWNSELYSHLGEPVIGRRGD
jgi:hypothetical protein